MIISVALMCFIFAFVGFRTERKVFNPLTVFCSLWGLILFLSSMHAYNLDLANQTTYSWIYIGIAMYTIGYYVCKYVWRNNHVVFKNKRLNINKYNNTLNYRIVYALLIVCIPFYLKDLVTVILRVGIGADLRTIQKLLQGNDDVFVRSSIENAIRFFIVNPFGWICLPITVVDYWLGKRDKKLIILTIILVVSRLFTTGGRASLIQLVFYFVAVYTFANSQNVSAFSQQLKGRIKKNKRRFILIGVLGIAALVASTFSRAGQSAIRAIYYDFAMQPMMLQTWAAEAEKLSVGYGAASLNGFLYPIDYLMRNTIRLALPHSFQEIYQMIMSTDTDWKTIGYGIRANAYVSGFWFFYVDGRVIGIAIGSFLFGFFCRISFRNMIKLKSQRNVAVYSMILISVFYTFGRFQFTQSSYVLGLIYLSLFFYKLRTVSTN